MKLKLLAAAAISALAVSGAQASTTNWGALTDLQVAAAKVDPGAFDDFISFSIGALSNLSSTTVANNLTTVLNISPGATVSLFSGAIGSGSEVGSYTFDGTTGSSWHTMTNLAAGNYYFEIKGTATGSMGGFYSITATTAPVPEPETYAMLLAGLGVVGSLYRRRKSV